MTGPGVRPSVAPMSTTDEGALITLAMELGLEEHAERYRREPKDRPPLDQRELLALVDELQGGGFVACEVMVRLTPAARAVIHEARGVAPATLTLRERAGV